jgi:hypothetical protein
MSRLTDSLLLCLWCSSFRKLHLLPLLGWSSSESLTAISSLVVNCLKALHRYFFFGGQKSIRFIARVSLVIEYLKGSSC